MGWLRRLFEGKDKVFLELLIKQAEIGVTGANALKAYMATSSPEHAQGLHDAEQEADEVRRILVDELNRTFVTPFDREDIFALSRALDDVLDYAHTTVEEMVILKVEPCDPLRNLTEHLHKAATELHLAMQRLMDHPNVANDHARRAKAAENRIERAYRESVAAAFDGAKEVKDVVTMLKLREVCRHLANAGDRADEAANIISDIVVKIT
jgi:predicted phosphate transport protein (TIGR00153 family)